MPHIAAFRAFFMGGFRKNRVMEAEDTGIMGNVCN